jgi:hypothetical protein
MKNIFPEKYRVFTGNPAYDRPIGQKAGVFRLPHPKISNYEINIIASSGMGWEHVSVTLFCPTRKVERCPTWEEMCFVKDTFWNKDETVVQYHPAEDQYTNTHPYCLHLWRPTDVALPRPEKIMV